MLMYHIFEDLLSVNILQLVSPRTSVEFVIAFPAIISYYIVAT